MADILAIIVGLLGAPAKIKHVIDPLKVQFSYLCRSDSILESLRVGVQRLEKTRANVQQRVDVARDNLETVRPRVEAWLREVEKILEEKKRIFRELSEVQPGCVGGSCLNLKRYSISRKAKKMTNEVTDLVRRGDEFDNIADPANPPASIPPAPGTEFDSRKKIEEKIMAALRDDTVYLIGITGMGGVGKTRMAMKIKERAERENLFRVAMAVATQQPNTEKIQQEIAASVNFTLPQVNKANRALHLHEKLIQYKKDILIIVDDVWKKMDLQELGIPSQSNHKRCKIILISRNREAFSRTEAMLRQGRTEIQATVPERTQIFSLECLGKDEAWAIFRATAGACVDDRDLHQIAKEVAEECKGLPLALVTVGSVLADKKAKAIWEDVLAKLKKPAPSNISDDLKDLYQPLELSYRDLGSDEARYFFLLCCLWPEDSRISLKNLLRYGVGLRIFSSVETLREARNSVASLVDTLESRNLLIDGGAYGGVKYVRMHDVIRDMAIHIASRDNHVFMTRHHTSEWPEEESYENCTCISLTFKHCGSVKLRECINCPTLKMFRMKKLKWNLDDFGWKVPETFFDKVKELNVLDIGGIGSLPTSLQSLTNLRTLRLRRGKMEDVSMIGQLVNLEILDLSRSKVVELPKEIGGLEKLKSLDLRWCFDLKKIAPGVISRMERLEELFVLDSFDEWEAEVEGEERRNASLDEVASLKNLTALQLHIPDPKVLPQDKLRWPALERYVICIGQPFAGEGNDYGDNNLVLALEETTPLVHALVSKADSLELTLPRTGRGASDELVELIQKRSMHFKSLKLYGCHNMESIIIENNAFPKLRYLSLSECNDLKRTSPVLRSSFDALEVLELKDLSVLTHFGDREYYLPNLREVKIENCNGLQCVFRDIVDHMEFPDLKELSLSELPNFICFSKADNRIESSQGKLDDHVLFNQMVKFASIVNLTLHTIDTATKIFSSQIPDDSFSRLEQLEVESCLNLEVIFSPPAFRNFRSLRHLTVKNCPKLKEVVEKEDEKSQVAVKEPLFPELKELKLSKLPNFETFCCMKNDIELPQLEGITIEDCHKMKKFSVGSVSLPRSIRLSGLMKPDRATQIFFKKEIPTHEIHFNGNSFTLFAKDLLGVENSGS